MKIGIVAGEKSGDFLASQLIKALRQHYPDAKFVGLCGPLMQAEGAQTLAEMDKISIFGLEGLFGSIREILAIRKKLFDYFSAEPPAVFIGVDVPDFNLRLEQKLKQKGIPTVHYVSPTVWAWRSGRVKKIRRAVNLMLTLFPFEERFYQQHQVPVKFVGHAMANDALSWSVPAGFRESLLGGGETLIAMLPGSRTSEVSRLAPEMIEGAEQMLTTRPGLRFVIPAANKKILLWLQQQYPNLNPAIRIINGQSRDLLACCDCAVLASGTAALEAALFAKPMVVMYKVARLSALVFGHTIRVQHFSMPNHLTSRPVVPELIQAEATSQNMQTELARLLDDRAYFSSMRDELATIAPMLSGDSSAIAAAAIAELINISAAPAEHK